MVSKWEYVQIKTDVETTVDAALHALLRQVAENGGTRMNAALRGVKAAFDLAEALATPHLDGSIRRTALLDKLGAVAAHLEAMARAACDDNAEAVDG